MSLDMRTCGELEFTFRDDPVKQFVDFATRTTKCFHQIIYIAPNAKDIRRAIYLKIHHRKVKNNGRTASDFGTKIVVMMIGRTKFIDSVNYIPMRLSDLLKTFGLRDTSGKGTFPHLFNTREN